MFIDELDRGLHPYIARQVVDIYENVRVTPAGDQTFNSGVSVGFDTRVSLTYNLGRYFFNVYGQFNNIRYHHKDTNGYLNDWFINTAIGIRL